MIRGEQISKELCDALGLPKHTRGFTLRCYSSELVSVECEYYPSGDFQTALARYHLAPSIDLPAVERLDFDAWMSDRTEREHVEHIRRTSRLPAGRDRRPPSTEEIARYHGISHGGID